MFVWRRVPVARGPVLMLLKGCMCAEILDTDTSISRLRSWQKIYGVKMYQKELYCLSILLSFPPELLSMFS